MTPATLDKRCTSCGGTVSVEKPDVSDAFEKYLNSIGVICDECSAVEDREKRSVEAREVEQRFNRRVRDSNLPSRWHGLAFKDMSVDEPGRRDAVVAARDWSRRDGKPGLMIVGNVGTGKTRLAGIATWHRLTRESAMWVSVPVLIALSAGGWGSDEKRQAVRAMTEGRRTLVLDDIDKVKASDWVASQLFAAIDSRVSAGSGLLVTANLDPGELAAKFGGDFGEAIVSRLVEHCSAHKLTGRDRRHDLL